MSATAELTLRVTPNAKRSECQGRMDDGVTWKIKLAAPAVEGKANEALRRYVAEICGVNRSHVEFLSGEKSRQKRLRVHGLAQREIDTLLAKISAESS